MSPAFVHIKKYLSLVRFSHTLFAMPFALIGFFIATIRDPQGLSWRLLVEVIGCMVFARSAAMAFNRWLDMHFDKLNPRTAGREIPSGKISSRHALWFVTASSLLFILTARAINPLCGALSFVALVVILGYSYTKRFTPLCHLVLGTGLALAPLGAYLAVAGRFGWLPIWFSLVVLFWVSGFDIIYALLDEEFDRSLHLCSIPAWLGRKKALLVSRGLHVLSVLFVAEAGIRGNFGLIYWAGATLFTGMLVYQQAQVREEDPGRINLAFTTINGIASCIFAVFVIGDLLAGK